MSFEWDPKKAFANSRKHGVRFSEAVAVFSDDYAITIEDDESDHAEPRFVTVGMGSQGRLLVVVYCFRGVKGSVIRIISARPAVRFEREQYEAQRSQQ